jgi:death-on-curing protein
MKYLTFEEILRLHFQVVEDYGGSHGVRSEDRFESVVEAPTVEVFEVEQYPGMYLKAAVYLRNIVKDHPFVDGNKRTGITVSTVYLMRNGTVLTTSPKELEDFTISVTTEHLDVPAIASWFETHSQPRG